MWGGDCAIRDFKKYEISVDSTENMIYVASLHLLLKQLRSHVHRIKQTICEAKYGNVKLQQKPLLIQ